MSRKSKFNPQSAKLVEKSDALFADQQFAL